MTRTAFKFLAHGARGPISGFAWPKPNATQAGEPGAWVEAAAPLALCRSGVHACEAHQLAHWLHDELWVVELAGDTAPGIDCSIASRARLLRQVEGWSRGGALRFAVAARDHAATLIRSADGALHEQLTAYLSDASAHLPGRAVALSAFCSAMTVAWLRGVDHFADAGYREERSWQAEFIASDLALQLTAATGA